MELGRKEERCRAIGTHHGIGEGEGDTNFPTLDTVSVPFGMAAPANRERIGLGQHLFLRVGQVALMAPSKG